MAPASKLCVTTWPMRTIDPAWPTLLAPSCSITSHYPTVALWSHSIWLPINHTPISSPTLLSHYLCPCCHHHCNQSLHDMPNLLQSQSEAALSCMSADASLPSLFLCSPPNIDPFYHLRDVHVWTHHHLVKYHTVYSCCCIHDVSFHHCLMEKCAHHHLLITSLLQNIIIITGGNSRPEKWPTWMM